MATFIILRQPVTILVTVFTSPNKLTNDLLIHNSLTKKQIINLTGDAIRQEISDLQDLI